MIEPTYNVQTHCNLLYALKVWNYLNPIRKRGLNVLVLKLLYIKTRCLINVTKICVLLGNGWRTTILHILFRFLPKSYTQSFNTNPLSQTMV